MLTVCHVVTIMSQSWNKEEEMKQDIVRCTSTILVCRPGDELKHVYMWMSSRLYIHTQTVPPQCVIFPGCGKYLIYHMCMCNIRCIPGYGA